MTTLLAYRNHTDHQLVGAYLGGNSRAFTEIVHRHHHNLLWVARRYGRNEDDAHDILQDGLLRAAQNLHTYRFESTLGTWLHRLVANSGYDFLYHRQQREQLGAEDIREAVPDDAHHHHQPLHGVSQQVDIDLAMVLRAALGRISPDHATALLLIDVIGYTVAHASAALGVPQGTIKSRRARAKAAMRTQLQASYEDLRS